MAQKKGDPGPEPAEGAAAKDGQPDDNELERRRRAKAGTSVAERVGNGEDEQPEEELFPLGQLDGDSKVTLKTLIKAGTRVTITASLSSAEIPLTSGLLDPEREVDLLVRGLPGGPVPVAKHRDAQAGGDHRIEEWTLRQPVRAIHVQDAGAMYTREQVLDLMHEAGVSNAVVARLMGDEEPSAAQG